MNFWEKIRKDIEKGVKDIEKGMKDGIKTIRKEAEVLAVEGKKKYKAFELKSTLHKQMADLGELVYSAKASAGNPLNSNKVKAAIAKIKKTEGQIQKLQSAKKKAKKKVAAKKKAAAKKKTAAAKSA